MHAKYYILHTGAGIAYAFSYTCIKRAGEEGVALRVYVPLGLTCSIISLKE
jgi:hypothetical protein